MAAVLACGDEAVVSHRAAAHLLGLGYFPGIEEVTVPRTIAGPAGVTLHTSRTIRNEQRTNFDAIPVTSVNRTLVDLADVVGDQRHLAKAVHEADIKQQLDVGVIYPLMNGRRGARRLKLALAKHRPVDVNSGLEFTLHHLIDSTDLPRPSTNVPVETSVRDFLVDFLWSEQRLIVEVDGPPHLSKRSFEEDRERDSLLQLAGYRVVRITEQRLRTQRSRVLVELSAHLGR
jgi:very-short-patch-repair endonuclease